MAGQCAPVPAGRPDPRSGCMDQGVQSCGFDGTCNGAGACRRYPAGSVCRPASCSATGDRVLSGTCDGNGSCSAPDAQSCAPYACGESGCKTACAGAADCAPGIACSAGSCGKKPLGAACVGAAECNSGFCLDGACCETGDCGGPCRSCNVAGAAGSCRELPTNAQPRAGGCAAEDPSSCGRSGKCDGLGGCQLYAPATPCGPRTCAAGIETLVPTCNGTGSCIAGRTQSCGTYLCSGDACAVSCTGDAQCASGAYCLAGTCRPHEPDGTTCSSARACQSGFCTDGQCCQMASCPVGSRCVGPGGTCSDKRALGVACAAAAECGSGFCADGVCCDSACTAECRRCDGASAGQCQVINNGRDANSMPPCNAPRRCTEGGVCR